MKQLTESQCAILRAAVNDYLVFLRRESITKTGTTKWDTAKELQGILLMAKGIVYYD